MNAMVEEWINQKLPYASSIDDVDFRQFLSDTQAQNLQELTESLAAAQQIPIWIKEATTLEMAHRRALKDKHPLEDMHWFNEISSDELALTKLRLAPETCLYPFSHDIISWYSSKGTEAPIERECFTIVGKGMLYISEGQYYLLELINRSNILGDAFDDWVRHFPRHASADASYVGEWVRDWIKQGVLVR